MNFFRGVLDPKNVLRVSDDGVALPLGEWARERPDLIDYANREIIVGLRPEDMTPAPDEQAGHPAFSARLEYVEPVGNEIFLNLRLGNRDVVARVPPMPLPEAGTDMRLRFRPDKLHCFDARTGVRIGG
jgi:multiple sugar transport system ATP-binding protein